MPAGHYDEVEIEDFAWDPHAMVFHYPCPCGDRFEITKGQLRDGEDIAICPSCSLTLRVIYDYLDWEDYETTDSSSESGDQTPSTPDSTSPAPAAAEEVPSKDDKAARAAAKP